MRKLILGLSFCNAIVGCSQSSAPPSTDTTAMAETKTPAKIDTKVENAKEASGGVFNIGDTAPAFADLEGTDSMSHGLADFADANAVAILFICNHCPFVVEYEERIMLLQRDFAEQGVQVIAVNVNKSQRDALPAMKVEAVKRGYTFPYLFDPSQQIARDFGAVLTPQIFLLDGDRKLAYVGPFDDNRDATKVTKKYLRNAIDAVLAGKAPETTEVEPFGCVIEYE